MTIAKPEVEGEHDAAERAIVFADEVVERGHHAVARTALVLCVVQLGVHPSAAQQLGAAALHALLLVRLAELGRDLRGLVVEVATPVGPADVVQDEQRQRLTRRPGGLAQHAELVVDGVPVVVAVDEGDVECAAPIEHVQAQVPVEHVPTAEPALVLVGVEGRARGR